LRYKQQRNKVNNLKRNAKENFEKNLDTIILENASNSKEYWKLMKKRSCVHIENFDKNENMVNLGYKVE
jgi:hypothetical protein